MGISSRLIVLGKHPLHWVWEDKFGSLLYLDNKKGYIGINPSVQQSQSQIASEELQGVAGELRCLGGKTDSV